MTLHLKAETEDAGTRLDAFVASHANGLTRRRRGTSRRDGYPWTASPLPRAAASPAARR